MQKEIDLFNRAFVKLATGYVKNVAERPLKEEPSARGAAQRFRLELADEVRVANLLAVTVGKMQSANGGSLPVGEPDAEPAVMGPGMVFQNGRAHTQDGPITANLGQGTYFRMENTPISAPCDPPNGVTVEVWDRLKNLCEFCKEMSKRGGIWAERSWGIDAAALEFAIGWIEGTQAAQEAAQEAPEAAVDKDTAPDVEASMRVVWKEMADILTGKREAPEGVVFNVQVNVEDTAPGVTTFPVGTVPDKP